MNSQVLTELTSSGPQSYLTPIQSQTQNLVTPEASTLPQVLEEPSYAAYEVHIPLPVLEAPSKDQFFNV